LTLLIDTAPLVALADAGEPRRNEILAAIHDEPGSLVIPAPTSAEIDHLLGQRLGDSARRAFLADLAAGRFTVAGLEREDYATIADIDARYAHLRLGLADCALIVLANRHETTRLLHSTSGTSAPSRHSAAEASRCCQPIRRLTARAASPRRQSRGLRDASSRASPALCRPAVVRSAAESFGRLAGDLCD
jgi:predicted nucleic acid-binding protein